MLGEQRYLEGFAHATPLSWWLLAVAAALTSGLSLATLTWQIGKAVLKGE
ncbi:MAG: hypothetical protein RR365_11565 [Bacteroides sp.]